MRTDKCSSGDELVPRAVQGHPEVLPRPRTRRCDPQILVWQRWLGLERRAGRLPRVHSLWWLNPDGRERKTDLIAPALRSGQFRIQAAQHTGATELRAP